MTEVKNCRGSFHNYEQAKYEEEIKSAIKESVNITQYRDMIFCTKCGDVKQL